MAERVALTGDQVRHHLVVAFEGGAELQVECGELPRVGDTVELDGRRYLVADVLHRLDGGGGVPLVTIMDLDWRRGRLAEAMAETTPATGWRPARWGRPAAVCVVCVAAGEPVGAVVALVWLVSELTRGRRPR